MVLLRSRFAAKCEIEAEAHASAIFFGAAEGIPSADYGVTAVEVLDGDHEHTVGDDELELLRIKAGTPRWAREIDDRILPRRGRAGSASRRFRERVLPGPGAIARQHYRGRVNRTLRVMTIEGDALPRYDAELTFEGKVVGRVTGAALDGDEVVALAYVRVEVPRDAELRLEDRPVTQSAT